MLSRLLKLLHEIGAAGVIGAYAVCLLLAATAPTHDLVRYASVRSSISLVCQYLLVPSLAAVLISGLLAIAANQAYKNAGWAWVKALLGISMFEGSLLTVVATARQAAELSALVASHRADPVQLASLLHTEWGGLWLLFGLSFANIVLAVWRPRFGRRVEVKELS